MEPRNAGVGLGNFLAGIILNMFATEGYTGGKWRGYPGAAQTGDWFQKRPGDLTLLQTLRMA